MNHEEIHRLYGGMILENTRLLVKGLERLHQGYLQENRDVDSASRDAWHVDKLRKFIRDAYASCREEGRFLYQNPYSELFRFRAPHIPQDKDETYLSGMLLLYHQLQVIEKIPVDQIADAYETLCNSIRMIQDAEMCYLVFRRLTETRILCASSVKWDCLNSQLSSREAEKLLDSLVEHRGIHEIVKGIYLKGEEREGHRAEAEEEENARFLILPMLLYDAQGSLREEQVYLISQRKRDYAWNKNLTHTLLRVRDTLFLRGQMAQILTRDLYNLLAAGREYRDIGRRSREGAPLRILHISDLHVTSKNCGILKNAVSKLNLREEPFDFLVITGDVAQGRSAAGDLEIHYDLAAEVIRALAFRMWSEMEGNEAVLRQDWKRRTIVIPGNHDYASMNELETQHGESHRTSAGGRPAAKEGSTMVKFTYYINFVRKLLDEDIGELIDSNLNKLIRYDKMGVDFLCFNTSIMANPARNNKVHLDGEFADQAVKRLAANDEKHFTIFLGHHGPDYLIDYLSDEYLEPYICHTITRNFTDGMAFSSDEDRKKALEALLNSLNQLELKPDIPLLDNEFIQVWLLDNDEKYLPVNTDDIKEKIVRRRKQTRLYHDLEFLVEQLGKNPSERDINERFQKIVSDIQRTRLLSEKDQSAYKEIFNSLQKQVHLTACLSGHTHEWDIPNDSNHYVARRFQWEKIVKKSEDGSLERNVSLHYGICELSWDSAVPVVNYQKREQTLGSVQDLA